MSPAAAVRMCAGTRRHQISDACQNHHRPRVSFVPLNHDGRLKDDRAAAVVSAVLYSSLTTATRLGLPESAIALPSAATAQIQELSRPA
jgi:hypothetical protein